MNVWLSFLLGGGFGYCLGLLNGWFIHPAIGEVERQRRELARLHAERMAEQELATAPVVPAGCECDGMGSCSRSTAAVVQIHGVPRASARVEALHEVACGGTFWPKGDGWACDTCGSRKVLA